MPTFRFVYNPNTVITGDPNNWFNGGHVLDAAELYWTWPDKLFADTIGQLGTARRNSLIGPAERNWDFSLVKDTKLGFLGEAGMLEFRAEFFNVMNHPNFSGQHFSTSNFRRCSR